MDPIPWYRSQVFVGAVVSIVSQILVLLGKQDLVPIAVLTTNVQAVFQIVALGAAGYAAWKRKASDIQPLKLRSPVAVGVVAVLLAALTMTGCTHTREAYREANSPDETAYVLAEHYAALVHEAANLAAKPTTPPVAVDAMRRAELAARPAVLALRDLRDIYVAAKTAENEAALQAAVNRAVQVIADLVRAVQAARGGGTAQLEHVGPLQTLVNYQPRPLAAGVAL